MQWIPIDAVEFLKEALVQLRYRRPEYALSPFGRPLAANKRKVVRPSSSVFCSTKLSHALLRRAVMVEHAAKLFHLT
jgi:hypothetical protein